MDLFRRKSRPSSSSTGPVEEPKSPTGQWNVDSVWTAESDDEISKRNDYKSTPKKSSIKSSNSSFYEEAMIITKVSNGHDPALANLDLINAIKTGDHKLATKALGNSGDADATTEDSNDVFTLTHLAAKNGHSLCLSLLISHDANIQTKTLHGWEPLHLAAYHGNLDCVTILLKSNADVNCQNHHGQTPLMMAVGEGHCHCVRELLRWNADDTILTLKKSKAIDLVKSSEMMKIMHTKGERKEVNGKLQLDIIRQSLTEMTANLDEEGARYELIEVENERLRKELQSVKMERDACEKTLQTIIDERDTIQTELEKSKKEYNKTAFNLQEEKIARENSDKKVGELEQEVASLDENIAKIIEQTTTERDNNAKNLQNLSEKFQMMMDEAASSIVPDQTDHEKLMQLSMRKKTDE